MIEQVGELQQIRVEREGMIEGALSSSPHGNGARGHWDQDRQKGWGFGIREVLKMHCMEAAEAAVAGNAGRSRLRQAVDRSAQKSTTGRRHQRMGRGVFNKS